MSDEEIRKAVLAAYKEKYPKFEDIRVSSITQATSGGVLAVVKAVEEGKDQEEVCYVDTKLRVRIFDASGELVAYLENLGSLRRWFFSGQGVSALAFFILLIALIVVTFLPAAVSNKDAFDVLRQMLVLAAGFFFGNQSKRAES